MESPGKGKQSSELDWGGATRDMAYGVQSVMFISMVRSIALSGGSIPRKCVRCCDLPERRGVRGSAFRRPHHQVHGDGVIAYFGCPTAHEDAAERAV